MNKTVGNSKDELTGKLELFIRKYYNNQILRGTILFVAIFIVLILIISVFEYFSYNQSWVRALLFYGFLLLNTAIFTGMILLPFLRKKGWIKGISMEEAAKMIGAHFPEIDDKLLNTLQLRNSEQIPESQKELLHAAVDLRISQLRPFTFHKAVDFRKNLRYVKYAAIPLFTFILLLLLHTELFTEPAQRIVHYNNYYEKPAPYRFVWTNPTDSIFQNENLQINVRVHGNEVPEEAFVEVDGIRYSMEKTSVTTFSYELKNVQKELKLQFCSEEVKSPEYRLKVLPKPNMIHFSIGLEYPSYLNKINESVDNNGNVTVPEGTRITWKFHTAHTEEVCLRLNDKEIPLHSSSDQYSFQHKALNTFSYTVSTKNRYYTNKDSLQYFIEVIPDAYPAIQVESSNDSLYFDRFYFKGTIEDDHGFRQLYFVYCITSGKDTVKPREKMALPFIPDQLSQNFYHYFDAQTLSLGLGETLHYHFEVWDNDGVNGSKAARTQKTDFKLPSPDEIKQQSEQVHEQTKEALSDLLDENNDLMRRIEEMQKKMLEKNAVGWQEKKELENMLKQWQELKQEMEEALDAQKRQQEMESQYETSSEEILQKQEELQKRIDELFSDEMKQTMSELQRLMEKNIDKEKLNQALDKIKISTEELNKQLDQDLALFKRLEVEKKMEEILQKTENLAKEQMDLSEKTGEKNISPEESANRQEKLQEDFKQLKEEMDNMQQMNNSLEDPYQLPDNKELQNNIQQEMNKAQESLQKNNKKEASSHQKQAGENLQKMQQQMEEAFNQSQSDELAEDAQNLRKILQRIVQTSFEQEKLMKQLSQLKPQDPQLKKVIQEQFMLKEKLRMIEDSISAVAKRQQAIKPFVNKQIKKINDAQNQILNAIKETEQPNPYYYYRQNNFNNAVSKQQFVMTGLNDLALMIAESINQMQQQQNASSSCKGGQCKPGGKQSNSQDMKSLRQMQEELNRQLEEMRKQQQQQGGDKEGGQSGKKQGTGSQSEQFARMAARQEAIRRMTQEYLSKMQKEGGLSNGEMGNLTRMMREMEKTEKELVNKILNQETINRQRNITTRMLQSERAEMQREKEDKRESKQGRDIQRTPPADWLQQKNKQKQQTELYQTVPPSLNYFYRQKANQYFLQIE